MTARVVLQWPDPRLLKTSKDVEVFDDKLEDLAEDLYHTMISSFGAGVAAPQVGIHKNVCVIRRDYVPSLPADEFRGIDNVVVLVNPVVKHVGKDKITWEEGCLSVEDLRAKVTRNNQIDLQYQNLKGEDISLSLTGTESATVQHEVDHLVGKLFIHRLSGVTRQIVMRKLRRRILESRRTLKEDSRDEKQKISESKRLANRAKRTKKKKLLKKNKKR